MSSIFLDGMYYPTADLLFKYSALNNAVISAETSRTGPGSVFVQNKVATTPYIAYSPPFDLEGTTIGFRFKNNLPLVAQSHKLTLAGVDIVMRFDNNYSIRIDYPGGTFTTDPAVWFVNTWAYFELQYTQGTDDATVTLRVNDSIPTTGGGTGSATASGLTITNDTTLFTWEGSGSGGSTGYYFQDLYIFDGLGSSNNDFIGDNKVDIIRPSAAGTHTDFTPSAGANWENVDEYACDLDTTYNKSSQIGDKDSYNLEDISLTGGTIYAVQQQGIIRKDDASIRYGKQLLISGTTEDLGDEKQFSDNFVGYQRTFDVDPDTGVAWTESGVNALESGLEITA